MKHPTIESIIKDTHDEIVKLVNRWELANYVGNEERYLEYTYAIAEKMNKIKALKRRQKFYKILAFWKKLLKDIG